MKTLSIVCVIVSLFMTTISLAQTPTEVPPPTVQAGVKGSTIKIDGRIFLGVFDTEDGGAFSNASFDVTDAKLRFTYSPSKEISVVSRLSFTKPSGVAYDYLYADLKDWAGMLPGHTLRLGRMKIDFGEETHTDNPVEGILITNSVSVASGYDEGLNFRGPIVKGDHPVTYSLSVLNGTKDIAAAAGDPATNIKIAASPMKNFYVSGSCFSTGDLAANSSDFKVAGLQAPPTGATAWKREAWEVDARWNYGSTGVQSIIPTAATAAVPFEVGAAYGQFSEDVTGAANRDGKYWYVEGLYNVTPKFYVASRYSEVSLENGATAKLADSPIAVNGYKRTSIGVGYRVSPLTVLKAEYAVNDTNGGASSPKINQLALGLATKF